MSATVNYPGVCGATARLAVCTLPAGHAGPHQAHGFDGRLLDEWLEPVTTAPGTAFAIRYRHGTDLADRWPEPSESSWPTRQEAETALRQCFNAASMEVIEIPIAVDQAAGAA